MPDTFTCQRCGRTSHHPDDARNRYCGACHTFGDPCAVCGDDPVVIINGTSYCAGHVDDGFALTLRGIAVLRGFADDAVDELEARAAQMFGHLTDPD